MVAQASYESSRGSRRAVIFVGFSREDGLEFFREIALKNLEEPRIPQSQRCTNPAITSDDSPREWSELS